MTRPAKLAALILVLTLVAGAGDKKRKKEEETQILELPKEPPACVVADSQRLVFLTSPLSSKGLLSPQVREALKWLLRESRGATIVKLRAFVAGTGDMRRVQAIVSETFTEKKLPLPALTVVQVGGLPANGAQVQLESIALGKKAANPGGVAFISGQGASIGEPFQPVLPMFQKSLAHLRRALAAAGVEANDVLRATCYLTSLDDYPSVRERAYAEYPRAAWTILQRTREPLESRAECEAVARLRQPPAERAVFLNPPDLGAAAGRSQAALVGPRPLALTGAQLAFGLRPEDARLAYQRLGKTLEAAGASYASVIVANAYPLSRALGETAQKTGLEFLNHARPPAGTTLPVEDLPALDASFAIDAIAAIDTPR